MDLDEDLQDRRQPCHKHNRKRSPARRLPCWRRTRETGRVAVDSPLHRSILIADSVHEALVEIVIERLLVLGGRVLRVT